MAKVKCRKCDRLYSPIRTRCPYCGTKKAGSGKRMVYDTTPAWQIVISIVILLLIMAVVAFLIYTSVLEADLYKKDNDIDISGIINADDSGVTDIENNPIDDTSKDAPIDVNAVQSLTIDKLEIELAELGDFDTITATVTPETAVYVLTWTSSNEEVCMVNSDGTVTAIGRGKATVSVTTGDFTAECTVYVGENVKGDFGISHEDVTISSSKGETFTLSVTGAVEAPVYESSDTSIATVTSDGLVKAISSGTAIITVTSGENSAQCIVRCN